MTDIYTVVYNCFVRRTQIYLDEDQKRALRAIAADKEVNMSDLVRGAIDKLLADEIPRGDWGSRFDALEARIRAEMRQEPTDEEIDGAVRAVRAERKAAKRA